MSDASEETSDEKKTEKAQRALQTTHIDAWDTLSWEGHIRIVLGEHFPEEDVWRLACVIPLEQAEQFAIALFNAVKTQKAVDQKDLEKKFAKSQAPSKQGG